MTDILKTWLVILALLLPALLFGLGERPLYKIQEVRIAETSREMLASGDWMVPRYNGELRLQKPPLPYWLTAASYRIFGLNLSAARLPAAVFGLLGTSLLFIWIRRRINLSVAANTALILATSFIGLRYFRSGEADAPLLFFVTLACLSGYELLQGSKDRRLVWAFFVALGLGFSTKGPAALAIPLLTVLIAAWREKKFASLKTLYSPIGWGLFFLLAFAWYAWMLWRLPNAIQLFVAKQVDETFVSGTHLKPFWWYFAHVFDFFAPWSVLLIPAAPWFYRNLHEPPAIVRFALIWLGVVLALLMLTVNKQTQYALLLAPPISVLLGYYADIFQQRFLRWQRHGKTVLWVMLGAFALFIFIMSPKNLPLNLLCIAIVPLPLLLKRMLGSTAPSTSMLLVAGLTVSTFLYFEQDGANEQDKTQMASLMHTAKSYQPLYQIKPGNGAVSFYAERVVPPVDLAALPALASAQGEIWVVAVKGKQLPLGQQVLANGEISLWQVPGAPR